MYALEMGNMCKTIFNQLKINNHSFYNLHFLSSSGWSFLRLSSIDIVWICWSPLAGCLSIFGWIQWTFTAGTLQKNLCWVESYLWGQVNRISLPRIWTAFQESYQSHHCLGVSRWTWTKWYDLLFAFEK